MRLGYTLGVNGMIHHIAAMAAATGAAPPATFTMTQLALANRVYQRDTVTGGGQGFGSGAVVVILNVTGAGKIYARRRSAADGVTILQAPWLAVANSPVANGAVQIPGVDADNAYSYLDLSGDGVTWSNGTTPIRVAPLILIWGQSMAQSLFIKRSTNTIASVGTVIQTNNYVFPSIDTGTNASPTAWALPSDAGTYTGQAFPSSPRASEPTTGLHLALSRRSKVRRASTNGSLGKRSATALLPRCLLAAENSKSSSAGSAIRTRPFRSPMHSFKAA